MSEDTKSNPQALSDEALDQASGGAQAVSATPKVGDGSVMPGPVAASGPPAHPGRNKGYEAWPC